MINTRKLPKKAHKRCIGTKNHKCQAILDHRVGGALRW